MNKLSRTQLKLRHIMAHQADGHGLAAHQETTTQANGRVLAGQSATGNRLDRSSPAMASANSPIRQELVNRVRKLIEQDDYQTADKLEVVVDRLLEEI